FGQPFSVLEIKTCELNHVAGGWLHVDLAARLGILEEVVRRGQAEIIEDCAPLVVLAVPLPKDEDEPISQVAVATFVTQESSCAGDIAAAAHVLGVERDAAYRWSQLQPLWPARSVEQLSRSVIGQMTSNLQNQKLKTQLTNVSQHLLQTFEELNLLHRINEHLSVSTGEQPLVELAIEWLHEVLPTECLLACIEPSHAIVAAEEMETSVRRWISAGNCPLPPEELNQFFDRLGPDARDSNLLIDGEVTRAPNWFYPTVREVISVPIRSGGDVTGWLLAVNRRAGSQRRGNEEFGTLETSLLSSVASILGMHSGNVQLFRDQEEFFEGMVRALSSAIDAKDPYTQGHSDRVARISVCLARYLGCTREEMNTIYLGGLLHDIGKIGIDDDVLRKPGNLSDEEYEHIKLHTELGYRILKRVKQLEHVLPVVLHHHEAWDGTGYPSQLKGEATPWLARIVAVADSFDAMSSDRPYRTGMPAGKLNDIFKNGAGQQWDARVIDAFFAIRDEIDAVVEADREELALDVDQWHS
ncbi:MAG: HD-GYP domain-containing protein, partial [Aeoliella sp.]